MTSASGIHATRRCVFLVTIAVAVAGQAQAQERSAAETLFRAGREAMKQQAYDDACAKFAESQRLDPSSGTLLNLAVCEERRGRVATAWARFRELLDTLSPADPRTRMAQDHASVLEGSLPRLRLRFEGDPGSDVVVRLDDAVLSGASHDLPIPIDPGEHRLEVVDNAGVIHREVVTIALGEQIERVLPSKRVEVALAPATEPGAGQQPPASPRGSTTSKPGSEAVARQPQTASALPIVGLAVAGVGVGALGAATYYAFKAKGLNDDSNAAGHCSGNNCDEIGTSLREQAGKSADIATILFATGAALGAGGLTVFLLTRGSKEPNVSLGLTLRPGLDAGHVLFMSQF